MLLEQSASMQSGLRFPSNNSALLNIYIDSATAIDAKWCKCCNDSRAFDMLNHVHWLETKLRYFGIFGSALTLVNYLLDGKQKVCIQDNASEEVNITS